MDELSNRPLSRRDALKALAGLTGAVALSSLPGKWQTPLVDVGALPAFAQCSPTAATAALEIVNNTVTTYRVVAIDGDDMQHDTIVVGDSIGCIEGLAPGEGIVYHTLPSGLGETDAPNSGMPYNFLPNVLHEYTINNPS